jgi:hypothetical protein
MDYGLGFDAGNVPPYFLEPSSGKCCRTEIVAFGTLLALSLQSHCLNLLWVWGQVVGCGSIRMWPNVRVIRIDSQN